MTQLQKLHIIAALTSNKPKKNGKDPDNNDKQNMNPVHHTDSEEGQERGTNQKTNDTSNGQHQKAGHNK